MITHDLKQGSPEWHEFRLTHFGASEAAAMLGLSPKVTRNELLHMKHTKTAKEYSGWVEKNLFEKGHEVEALARPIIEDVIDDDLYPVTCSKGNKSASCDGLTLDCSTAFEHKQYNVALASYLALEGTVPEEHMPQCQQIMMVTGAEKVIFVTSDGTLKKHSRVEVLPNLEWQEKIKSGWIQFEKDLAEYKPRDLPEKIEPNAIMELPVLSIKIKGEVIASNLSAFKADAESFISRINTDLETDEDFANAEATVKFCDETEKKLDLAKKSVLGQTESIDDIMRTIDFIKEELRSKRLNLSKKVKNEKEKIKLRIMNEAEMAFGEYLHKLNKEVWPIELNIERPDFPCAMKNKRTLESLHNAADTELARCKIIADKAAELVKHNLSIFSAYTKDKDEGLFRDLQVIAHKEKDDFELIVKTRIAEHEKNVAEAAARKIESEKADNIQKDDKNQETVIDAEQPVQYAPATSPPHAAEKQELITIPMSEYLKLKDDSLMLRCLTRAGVRKWGGYSFASEEYKTSKVKIK